jgi:hypothetical protein
MNLLWANQRGPAAPDLDNVRSTTNVINRDDPVAMQENSPEYNQTFTDPDTEGGLTEHQVSSHIIESVKADPRVDASAQDEHNAIVNRQVSTSGFSPHLEALGIWGHGTLKIVEGIEPTIVDGHELRSDYMAAHPRPDMSMQPFMTPAKTADPATSQAAQATGQDNSRTAVQESMYSAFYHAQQAGL